MTNPTPTICVVVVARNEAELISGCIGSIARQSRPADQVILVDDGSTDAAIVLPIDLYDPESSAPSIGVIVAADSEVAQRE